MNISNEAMIAFAKALGPGISTAVKDACREILPSHSHDSTTGKEPCCDGCKNGGACEASCPGTPPMFQLPQCYGNCKTMSNCLRQYMRVARELTDEGAWLEYLKSEIPLVHINQQIGGAPNYQNTLPLGAAQNIVLMQEAPQILPYEPGLVKIDTRWNGNPAPAEVTVNIYTGTDAVTAVTTTPAAAGLIQIGRSFTLADFECKDDCYLLAFPDVYGCEIGAIPFRRRVFFELRGGAMGASTLTSLGIAILKRHTKVFGSTCAKYGIVV